MEKTPRPDSSNQTSTGRAGRGWSKILGATLGFFCVALSWRALNADHDFWAHAAVGRWIWNHGSVPTHSLFLWSAEGFPWIAHSWLSQLSFYGLIQGGGWAPQGKVSVGNGPFWVVAFTSFCVALTWLLLWRLWNCQARPGAFALVVCALGVWAGSLRYYPRPELLTAVFWTLTLCFLARRETSQRETLERKTLERKTLERKTLERKTSAIEYSMRAQTAVIQRRFFGWKARELALVGMFALWANFHGAVFLGVALMAITAFFEVWQHRFDARSRRFCCLVAACALATGLVPFGAFDYWNVLVSTQSATFSRIQEWQPILPLRDIVAFARGGAAPDLFLYATAEIVLALLAFWAWNANPNRRWAQAAWIVFFGVLLLRQRRHMWLFALLCVAVVAANAAHLKWRAFASRRFAVNDAANDNRVLDVEKRGRAMFSVAAIVGVVFWGVTNSSPDLWARRAVSPLLPDGVCQVLQQSATRLAARGQSLRVFNDYENSSYLQWRLSAQDADEKRRIPLFIDLLNAYPDSVLEQYIEVAQARASGRKRLQTLRINCVVLGRSWQKSELAKFLAADAQWTRLYASRDGDIWIRRALL